MSAVLARDTSSAANDHTAELPRGLLLPPRVAEAVWHGNELGLRTAPTALTGWPELDAELPGGGWPRQSLSEVLTAQPAVLEWRLLAPALKPVVEGGGQVVVIGPPRHPHLPGLQHVGLDEGKFIWIQADLPAERLWTAEQLIKSNAAGAIIAWLPKARSEQLRRLQVCAQNCEGLVFICRPDVARHESSAAPLRVLASVGLDWELKVNILKRRGPSHEHPILLPSIPGGLASVLTPRLRRPSRLIQEAPNVVGSPAVATRPRQHAAA
ncbi:translesion DNA synthesis-associated protein ImuA [Variovorax sp. YR216]|uniref:translesion DNA synthesis-associated protein ImuA n=1 Tax=Variovorax sp. YR216 TaxID=1882828 RepID=UPI0008990B03|nr:translesion DNA synthesis-associated protein ImuA [Variovorax sp. YR216]SEA87076.1 protein ImuA [Variovorax sp. YR216]